MVEISLSGSGEGPGWVTAPGYSTAAFSAPPILDNMTTKPRIRTVIEQAKRIWYKWLCRRSHRTRLTWERFADLLRDFPLPRPRITVRIWGS